MIRIPHALSLFFLFGLLTSCSSSRSHKENKNDPQPTQKIMINYDQIEQNLDQLVTETLKKDDRDYTAKIVSDLYLKASFLYLQKNYKVASFIFHSLIKLRPKDHYLKLRLSLSLIRSGELIKAHDYLAELVDLYNKMKPSQRSELDLSVEDFENGGILSLMAGLKKNLGLFQQSEEIYLNLLKKDQKNEQTCLFLAKLYEDTKDSKKMQNILKKCHVKNKKSAALAYALGKSYVDEGKYNKSIKYFLKSIKNNHQYTPSLMALGLIYEQQKRYKDAIKYYSKYADLISSDQVVLTRLLNLLFNHGDLNDASKVAKQLISLRPDDLNLKVKLGVLYTELKRYNEAIIVFQNLVKEVPSSDKLHYYLGALYAEIGDYNQSLEEFYKVKEGSELYSETSLQIAQVLSLLANNDEGKKNFENYVLKTSDKLPALRVNLLTSLAEFYQREKRIDDSISILDMIKNEQGFNNHHRYFYATLLEDKGKFDEAYSFIFEIIKRAPNDAHAYNFLAYSFIERNLNLDQAYVYAQKAFELSPKDGHILDTLGWYYFKINNYKRAQKYLSQAMKQRPDEYIIYFHLAQLSLKLNKSKDANKYINLALKYANSQDQKKEIVSFQNNLKNKRLPANE